MTTNIKGIKETLNRDEAPSALLQTPKKRNLIFMVSDGMGPASLSLTRSFRQFTDDLDIDNVLTLDKHFIGQSRTRSSDSLVTDSAAGATAFSCGLKSYNGAIAIQPNKAPCGTLLEAAKLVGYMTGLVVTTRITDATPAAFSAHANYRFEEDLIAQHQLGQYPLGRMVDLIIGGGRCHFLPSSKIGGCRRDTRNLVQEAQQDGWSYVSNLKEFNQLDGGNNVSLPLLGLLAPYDIPYDIDRQAEEYPSLEDQTRTALRALEKATANLDKGFFIMIEGSRIDHAGHHNDPAAQVREVLAYDRAFKAAIEFSEQSDVETIVISTSDHETGGLATAKQMTAEYPDYLWFPEALANASHSGEYLASALRKYDGHKLEKYIQKTILGEGLGVFEYTEDEMAALVAHKQNALDVLVQIVSNRSQTGWSTHGHSAVDVNIYAGGSGTASLELVRESLAGNHENTEIGSFMEKYLGLDLNHVTELLQKKDFDTLSDDSSAVSKDQYHNIDQN